MLPFAVILKVPEPMVELPSNKPWLLTKATLLAPELLSNTKLPKVLF